MIHLECMHCDWHYKTGDVFDAREQIEEHEDNNEGHIVRQVQSDEL